jgi:hypothetical protein
MPSDMMAFWSEHPPLEAFAAVDAVLGKVVHCQLTGQFKGHHILHIGYPADFDLSTVEPRLRQELDAIGWQFVTTGTRLELRDTGEIPSFGVAPILLRAVPVAYHATRACAIPLILKEGLHLPALTAIRFNPRLPALYERLLAAGKAKMAAVGACLRKLLMIAYGVLKNRTPFDPSWATKSPP